MLIKFTSFCKIYFLMCTDVSVCVREATPGFSSALCYWVSDQVFRGSWQNSFLNLNVPLTFWQNNCISFEEEIVDKLNFILFNSLDLISKLPHSPSWAFVYWWFSARGRHDYKIPLNRDTTFFDSRNGYSSVNLLKLLIFSF